MRNGEWGPGEVETILQSVERSAYNNRLANKGRGTNYSTETRQKAAKGNNKTPRRVRKKVDKYAKAKKSKEKASKPQEAALEGSMTNALATLYGLGFALIIKGFNMSFYQENII